MAGEQHPFDLPQDPEVRAAPGVGDESGTPQGAAPVPQPPNQDDDYRKTVESLKPLTIFAEALKDPAVQQRVINAFTGAGAPPRDTSAPQGPSLADQETTIKSKYVEQRKAAMATGDFETAFALSSQEGAEIGELRSNARFQTSAGPIVSMTARNTVESWIASKTATSPLFAKLADKFRVEVNKTSPEVLAQLATQGTLLNACELTWNKVVAENYEAAYNKNAPTIPTRPAPPSYSMGGGGGGLPAPDTPSDDDKDDEEFQKWAQERGVNFAVDSRGAITGELK